MVNFPKQKKAFCRKCKKHTLHAISWQKKAGKASLVAQGKRRYDRKQQGFGGQTKPVFKKNVKTTKKVVLKFKCSTNECGLIHQICLRRCVHFEIGGQKKQD